VRGVAVSILVAACAAAVFAVGGAASPHPDAGAAAGIRVPSVVGMRMDRATRTLRSVGLRVNEECSGLFGCVVKSQWWVCSQSPRAGTRLQRYAVVVVYAERRGEC
jgi:beta-lactam-binding protein with PASTA domain